MSELINNSQKRKERLKELILKLHQGESAEVVRQVCPRARSWNSVIFMELF
jgi:DUF438 domain-containing protein